jgi:hypothetical protein
MKPRRENGAVLVSPMTSDVNSGSVLIGLLLLKLGRRIQRIPVWKTQITWLREAVHGSVAKTADAHRTKNKAVDAVCRQRPCQPRKLKSALAFR